MLIYPNGSILRLEIIQTRKVKITSPTSLEIEYPLSFRPPHTLDTRGKLTKPITTSASHHNMTYNACIIKIQSTPGLSPCSAYPTH